jgi:hypothetical protein
VQIVLKDELAAREPVLPAQRHGYSQFGDEYFDN